MPFTAYLDRLRSGAGPRVLAALAALPADNRAGPVAATWFLHDDLLVRVVDHPEDEDDPAARLVDLPASAAVERALAPFLAGRPDPAGQVSALRSRQMARVQQRVVRRAPGATLSALYYPVRPGHEELIAATFERVRPQRRPMLHNAAGEASGTLHGVAVFVRDGVMVRVVSYDGDIADVARYMATRPGRPDIERALAGLLLDPEDTTAETDFIRAFPRRLMRRAVPASVVG